MPNHIWLRICAGLLACAALLAAGLAALPGEKLEIKVLAVGQGDAILLRTPLSHRILVDAGPGSEVLAPLAAELSFWERSIDLLVLTHPDLDHISGASELLRRYEIRNVLLTGAQHDTATYAEILQQIAEQKINVILATAQTDFDFGGVEWDTLYPLQSLAGTHPSDANQGSIVAQVRYDDTSLLLTGDADLAIESELIRSGTRLKSDLLKLGHHGARTSSSAEFIAAVAPQIALVSAGAGNKYGHPHSETLERLGSTRVLSTLDAGTLRLESDGHSWQEQ